LEPKLKATLLHKVCGFYKIEAVKKDGSRRLLADWFPNLILDQGLDRLAINYDFMEYCQVGSGNTTPANSDIGLATPVASTNTHYSSSYGVNGSSPYYVYYQYVYRFAAGVAAGNLSEVGVGWNTGDYLFSRSLILDIGGSPTSITVLSDEYLDVTYEYRFYPYESDVTGSLTFTGDVGGTYSYTLRQAYISSFVSRSGSASTPAYPVSMNNILSHYYAGTTYLTAFTGSLGAITSGPSSLQDILNYTQIVNNTYTAGTFTLTCTITANIADWNYSPGIAGILFTWGPRHYQIGFGSVLPKTNQDKLTLTFTHTWARYTP
jgi:hypothetical protein